MSTGRMATARSMHTATLLNSGKVLVTGGLDLHLLASCEIYDPSTSLWNPTASMANVRYYHTATLLNSGKVLVTGGWGLDLLASCEIYDPSTGQWSITASMGNARDLHTATLLNSGKVLVTGGVESLSSANSNCEIYDPSTGLWSFTGSMKEPRRMHTATLLNSGQVLVTGGRGLSTHYLNSCEIYDPSTGLWSPTASMANVRQYHTATLLNSGQVLVTAGADSSFSFLTSSEIYDPSTGQWTTVGSTAYAHMQHAATLLNSGKVLVAGGEVSYINPSKISEIFDPSTGQWNTTANMAHARMQHAATLLDSGEVLITGGGESTYRKILYEKTEKEATYVYLSLINFIITAFIDQATPIDQRIFYAWVTVFSSRLWKAWLQYVRNPDEILDTGNKNDVNQMKTKKVNKEKFYMTNVAYQSLELNAHNLLFIAMLVVEEQIQEDALNIFILNSQTCESTFRMVRSMSGMVSMRNLCDHYSVSDSESPCTKCAKNAGITTCDGCLAKFCRRCFNDHRQDLSKELDNAVYEHDILKQELEMPNKNNSHHLLKQIDEWKKDSIDKINQLADECR
ncbi:unnamed protein product, partial [Didymodactylos carnosus]